MHGRNGGISGKWRSTHSTCSTSRILHHGQVLKQVDVFNYLGHILSQDDDDHVQAVHVQIRKARANWDLGTSQKCNFESAPNSTRQWFSFCYFTTDGLFSWMILST